MRTVRLGIGDVGACVCVMKVKTRLSLIYITSEPRILNLHSFHGHKPHSPQACGSLRAQFKPGKANAKADRSDRLSMGLEGLKALVLVRRIYRYCAISIRALSRRLVINLNAETFGWPGRIDRHG